MALNALYTARGRLGFRNAAAMFITDQQGLDSLMNSILIRMIKLKI